MSKKLLFLEDEPDIRKVGETMLNRSGYAVTSVGSIAEATGMIAAEWFDILITDFQLADGFSTDFVSAARERYPKLVVVVITGRVESLPDWMLQGQHAVKIVPKPFSFFNLIETIAAAHPVPVPPEEAQAAAILSPRDEALPKAIENIQCTSLRTDGIVSEEIQMALEEQLERETEERRMVALGKMTDGVLHDLNNILTGVMGIAEEHTGAGASLMRDAVGRMAKMTRRLRDYSAGIPTNPAWFRLGNELTSATSLARYRAGSPANLKISHNPSSIDDCEIFGNESQIFEVILNLLINAIEAMGDSPAPRICIHTSMEGGNAVIFVSDNGPGVPPSVVSTLFDPHSSTKGRGRGLGLPGARQIALAHGGNLTLEQQSAGGGARFRLELPARLVASNGPAPESPSAKGQRVILVMEDDHDVLRMIERAAQAIGLAVMLIGNGREAPVLTGHTGNSIAGAILDSCSAEDEDGVVAALRRALPDIPILLISALLRTPGRADTRWGSVQSLPKPFTSETLADAMYSVLAPAESSSTYRRQSLPRLDLDWLKTVSRQFVQQAAAQ